MKILKIQDSIVEVVSDDFVITDTQSALDLIATIKYETGDSNFIIDKNLIVPEFFVLRTTIAGEILQKYINYHVKMAIYGDFSGYYSKALKDFMYESNKGKDFFFVSSRDEAIQRLANVI